MSFPRKVMRTVDSILPRHPRLEDFGTELLAIIVRNRHGNGWSVPPPVKLAPKPTPIPKRKNRYDNYSA